MRQQQHLAALTRAASQLIHLHQRNTMRSSAFMSSCSVAAAIATSADHPAPTAFVPRPPSAHSLGSVHSSSRSFHSSPIVQKKRRNRWKSVRKYAAERERNNSSNDEADEESFRMHANTTGDDSDQPSSKEAKPEQEDVVIYDDPSDSVVKSKTLDWIRKVVIGLNLCPFAASPLSSNKLSVEIVRGKDAEAIAAAVLLELILRVDKPGTTVVVAPECHPNDFETYLEVANFIEGTLMEEHELTGLVQVAPFHPLFEFGGSGDGVDNYTNRSPYPMFHVLREEEVSAAVDKFDGDAGKVWRRNVRLLEVMEERLTREGVEKVMGCDGESLKDEVDEILQIVKEDGDDDGN